MARRDLPGRHSRRVGQSPSDWALPEGVSQPGGVPPTAKLLHTRADLRSPQARAALAEVDVLYHLGFQLWTDRRGAASMEEVNVAGTANVIAGGPRRVVLASSAAVYGAWPDNPCPLAETDPARPNPECAYAGHKLAVERICRDAAETVSLRVAAVLGPHADPAVRRAVGGYRLAVPAVSGVQSALQFLDEADAVAALMATGSARGELPPVLNVAPDGWLDAAGVAEVSGGRVLSFPRGVLLRGSQVGHRLRLFPFGVDRAVLVSGPLALDPTAAAASLGWRATKSSAEVLRSMLGR